MNSWEKTKTFFREHKKIRRTAKFFMWFFGVILLFVILTFGTLEVSCRPQSKIVTQSGYLSPLPAEHVRPEVTTYIRYPEWFIVYSSDEYAQFLESNRPSHFPYFGSIRQYWSNYCKAYAITKARNEFSAGDHLMLFVIGWSYTGEYVVKGLYENTVGRLSELFGQYPATDEDRYADVVAKDYVDFIELRPWYEYNFAGAFKDLWLNNSFFGGSFPRKIERKFFLSLEYGFKTGYGWLIGLASHAVYGYEDLDTYAVLKNAPPEIFQDGTQVKKVSQYDANTVIASIPRYQPFTEIAPRLAEENVQFVDIAGNKEIFLSALVPSEWNYAFSSGQVVFSVPILTHLEKKRIAVSVPVEDLSAVLNYIRSNRGTIEHIYDY